MEKLRILLVDDEPLLLESLEIILTLNGMEVAGMARDGREALEVLAAKPCDLALVDLNMRGMGGIELIARVKTGYPHVKLLVLTTFYDDKNITQAISRGADAYLLKDSGKDAILGAIGQVMGGRVVLDGKVMQRLALLVGGRGQEGDLGSSSDEEVGRISGTGQDQPLLSGMTRREKEICTLLTKGLNNRQIAETLYISEGTVKNYISSIYDKTGIHDRAKLMLALR